ncbi:MAG: U32 family peptidase [Clostridia bacterium]|nr:U32 family peptidase [Clostridia bacterium]
MDFELLAPAGNMEKLKTAFHFGTDACYFAGTSFGLRAFSKNFDEEELKTAVEYAHSLGKKCYITINIIAHDKDFPALPAYVKYLEQIGVDAVIVADIGVMSVVKQTSPNLPIHVSTQANITNKYSAKQFVDMGATRLILARELSLEEIKEIRDYIPDNVEIECFVHGAMCISYSGRCLLSNYFCGRDANHGECVQACRWEYSISRKERAENEKGQQNEHAEKRYEILEDDRGTYILNSKDLNMIEYLDKLAEAGVSSFKIEGRMKSPYYVGAVVNAYARALAILKDAKRCKKEYVCPDELKEELEKISHRKYTTGFYFGADNKEYLEDSQAEQSSEFVAVVLEDSKDGKVLVEMRNRFEVGDTLEIVSATGDLNKKITVKEIVDEEGNNIQIADKVQAKLRINCDVKVSKMDILRR